MKTNSAEETLKAVLASDAATLLDAIDASPNVVLFPPRAPLPAGVGDEICAGLDAAIWFEKLAPDDRDFETTRSIRAVEGVTRPQTAITAATCQHIVGGIYDEVPALELINGKPFVGTSNDEVGIFRMNEDESASFVPEKEFKWVCARLQRVGVE